ncbi:dnaJ homolog subfamily C member 30, mitochondrial-like [Belonocnema kinseyi]|uniref:dnaJ homolog subfamily C member 30, mitochondrial-like n=1 Tax=Belonocnema kinseyi TaxID=2817044 RepID=UPI00143D3288|nr:dnaJ homolog subfamily C member 30, mitochondrial-like [Belonocnema kinseyi]
MNFPRPRKLRSPLTSFSCCMSSSSRPTNHYDTLQVEPNATQEEIKTSYYKLTKQYHPDVNKTEEAKGQFRNVSEAYEILGNYKARKKYDRGIVARGTSTPIYKEEKEHPHMAFYKSRMDKYPKPVRTSDSKVYDFDAWTRAHYGQTLKKTIHKREANREAQISRDNMPIEGKKQLADFQITIGFVIILVFSIFFLEARENFDIVVENPEKKSENES